MNYEQICAKISEVARNTGRKLLEYRAQNALVIETKGHNDFVTQMDKYSEQLIVAELEKIVPEAGFIAEESTRTNRGEHLNWIIDPIDGTTNFIHNLPTFAISIALMNDDEVVCGVVYELNRDELFSAWLGGGAYLNGKRIRTSAAAKIEQALVATGFPYNNFELLDNYTQALLHFMKTSHGVRRIGSAATDMAYVAAGRFDAFFEYDLKPYDVAAGCILVSEADGRLSDFGGGRNYIFGHEMVATNGLLYNEFMQTIKEKFGR